MSNVVYYVLLVLAIILNSTGGILMKIGSNNVSFGQGESLIKTIQTMMTNWQLIIGIGLYGTSFVVSTLVYTKIPLNIAYPIILAGTLILVTISSVLLLKEGFTGWQLFGSIFLIIGIGMIARSLKS